jgi:two-component system NtrC family sensor kinase
MVCRADDKKICLLTMPFTTFSIWTARKSPRAVDEMIAMRLAGAAIRAGDGPLKYHEHFDDSVFNAQYTPIPRIGSAVTMQDISYLKELDRLKSDFIHTVSHDLRSPLTSILGYTELVERTGPLNANQLEFLHRLQGSIHHITTLINDLLDLGRLEAGFDTRREAVQLEGVLHYSLDMFDGQLKKKKIILNTDITPDLHPLRANPIRIRQMLDNLIGNAIKYTPDGGRIGISMSMQDDQVILKVEDTAMNPQFRLGLAIVKSIVDSHQGRVWVESVVGKGSTFIVLLPAHE